MKLFVKIIAIISSLFLTAGLCSCGSEKPDSKPIIESVTENENNEEIAEEHTESETESNTDQEYAQDSAFCQQRHGCLLLWILHPD